MNASNNPLDTLIHELKERAKELSCLYKIQELLGSPGLSVEDICQGIVEALPPGWQYPDVCGAQVVYGGKTYQTALYQQSPWVQSVQVMVQEQSVGTISVCYTEERPPEAEGPFLQEERKLINTIAEQFGFYLLHLQLRQVFQEKLKSGEEKKGEWWVILDLLRRTDTDLLLRVTNKMVNFLFWSGVKEAEELMRLFSPGYHEAGETPDENRPFRQRPAQDSLAVSDRVFTIASQNLSEQEILENIQLWIKEDRSGFLVNVLVNPGSSLADISAAIERFHLLSPRGLELTRVREKWFRSSLIRRVMNDQPAYIQVAKDYLEIDQFNEFVRRMIFPAGSHGKLGGKSSGLFLASQILSRSPVGDGLLQAVKTPKTWYLTSDAVFYFISHNNLENVVEQKYKDLAQVRQEYPYIQQVFKNASFPPEIIKGLSLALEDFNSVPLIVRSSSLLEDRAGTAFAGKYKSLFIANQGSKEERLQSLLDAVAEIYASMFAPDPIEYRHENRLVDEHEEMGIMIQQVVGSQVGRYFFPAFAGVAFSHNDFRWSSRIRREDGLVRLVPGLGTRAVDRLSDDYPVLISPGQPGLRVNLSLDEIIRYSPKKLDLINLQSRRFETVEIRELLREYGPLVPCVDQLVSVLGQDRLLPPSGLGVDFEREECVLTFEGLFKSSPFLKQIQAILHVLQEALGYPVDIEFADDGRDFYLLQCRMQSYGLEGVPVELPRDLPPDSVIFTANRYITNASLADIAYIVYVDPLRYGELSDGQDMLAVGRAVGRLNRLLPPRQFILMGPGRWGSRGDIRLGVSVTYSDISNTAMLVEIARQYRDYTPDPSFGTHFFQDLVEASIRYLPLYPDDRGVTFNEAFLVNSPNSLPDLLPDLAYLSPVLRVIDLKAQAVGQVLQVVMNAEAGRAVAWLSQPSGLLEAPPQRAAAALGRSAGDVHWRWRLQAAEAVAAQLDPQRFGVRALYVFGSANNATAGPESDIDLLVHFQGSPPQRKQLLDWLDGWSLVLAEMNYQRTGHRTSGLLDVHLVTDDDVRDRLGFAHKIGALSDAARPLPLGAALHG